MDRPSGSWIEDPETGELAPDLADQAMAARFAVSVLTGVSALTFDGTSKSMPDPTVFDPAVAITSPNQPVNQSTSASEVADAEEEVTENDKG